MYNKLFALVLAGLSMPYAAVANDYYVGVYSGMGKVDNEGRENNHHQIT